MQVQVAESGGIASAAEVMGENTEKGEKRTTENEAKKRVSKGAETALKEKSTTERANEALGEEVAPMLRNVEEVHLREKPAERRNEKRKNVWYHIQSKIQTAA